ncbi:sugar ABC transporter ATP-binding protein [Methylocapsa sp. S129]|uniref:sugar ABC transporter ATP-binding protein n=1 Tax=Methylocapsa sp. S129 TaxID=1641869 RepID=UPI00131B1100|nr:sugar ABC transporter ATP-binding protein [Methylocapsa sp. S129]
MSASPPVAQPSSLTLRSVSKTYGATLALDAVDLSIERGEVVALMGANGAGKSTLAKIAAGVIQPDHGEIVLAGLPVRLASPLAAHQAGVVTVHQSTELLGVANLTVAENLILGELCGGSFGLTTSARRIRLRAAAVAAGVGLDLPLDRQFGDLGPAQRQLVAIARAAATDAKVLILDEPTASLAAAEADRLFEIIDRVRSRGVGVLYISHRLGDIKRIADRIVVLRNGRRVADQTKPFDLSAAIRAMIGRDLDGIGAGRENSEPGRLMLQIERARLTPGAAPFDLNLRSGEILAVTGALGSGKSRLLRALFGLGRLTEGDVLLEGEPWRPHGPAQAIARGVFFAGEDRWRTSFLPPATPGADIAGAIALPHRRSWFPRGILRDRRERNAARRAIEALGIRCRDSHDELDRLSGGNQQKVVVARWQAAPCRLLLLDEPFQGVDVGARQDLVQAIRAARSNSATLIATSDVEEAIEVADVVAVMRDHAIVGAHDLRGAGAASLLGAIAAVEAGDLARQDGRER